MTEDSQNLDSRLFYSLKVSNHSFILESSIEGLQSAKKLKGEIMLEVQNIKAVNKGMLLAICDVHIIPWRITLREVKVFQKGNSRWLGMPSKEYTSDSGEKRYTELIAFDNDEVKNRFRSQIMGVIDKFLAENPDMKPESVIKEEDLPF